MELYDVGADCPGSRAVALWGRLMNRHVSIIVLGFVCLAVSGCGIGGSDVGAEGPPTRWLPDVSELKRRLGLPGMQLEQQRHGLFLLHVFDPTDISETSKQPRLSCLLVIADQRMGLQRLGIRRRADLHFSYRSDVAVAVESFWTIACLCGMRRDLAFDLCTQRFGHFT